MNDKSKLKLTKIRLANLQRKRKSLFDLSAEKITLNIKTYVYDEEKRQQIESLPRCIQQRVMITLTSLHNFNRDRTDMFEIILEGLDLLLRSRPRHFQLNSVMTFCIGNKEEWNLCRILQQIATHAPDIECLEINDDYHAVRALEPKEIDIIANFTNIKKLRITNSCRINYSDLIKICKNKRNLRYLEVHIRQCVRYPAHIKNIEDFLGSLPNLKEFRFKMQNELYDNILIQQCWERLPQLQSTDAFLLVSSDFPKNLSLPALRRLASFRLAEPDLHVKFPNVTHLKIQWKYIYHYVENEMDALLHFRFVSHLELMDFPAEEAYRRYLKVYGERLRTLKIIAKYHSNHEYSFKYIFKLCPKMENLILENVCMEDDAAQLEAFSNLKKFSWVNWRSHYGRKRTVLSNILSAPLLQEITLKFSTFPDTEDMFKISNLIAEGQILKNTKIIRLHIRTIYSYYDEEIYLKALSCMVINASAFLPQLTELVVCVNIESSKSNDSLSQYLDAHEHAFKICVPSRMEEFRQHLRGNLENIQKFVIRLVASSQRECKVKPLLARHHFSFRGILALLWQAAVKDFLTTQIVSSIS